MGTLTYPTPMDSLSGNHDRIVNLEPRRAAAKRDLKQRGLSLRGIAALERLEGA